MGVRLYNQLSLYVKQCKTGEKVKVIFIKNAQYSKKNLCIEILMMLKLTSSAVHSAMLVGFESAKMIGTSLNLQNITLSVITYHADLYFYHADL